MHHLARLPNPMDALEGKLMWKGLRRQRLKKAQRRAAPLSWETIQVIVGQLSAIEAADGPMHATTR